ncbi:SirB2 family protein [Vibrio sp.]|uniref:SirB2 family protein n=1 Tax=Vibrio sp. TaxID=678 RepID=UPI003D11B3D2
MYHTIKLFHLITIALSVTLFITRFAMFGRHQSVIPTPGWLKPIPHFNDTLLFSSGIALISITKFVPFTQSAPWLSYKLAALTCYIICGYLAMSSKHSFRSRWLFFISAICWLMVIVLLAVTKNPAMIRVF